MQRQHIEAGVYGLVVGLMIMAGMILPDMLMKRQIERNTEQGISWLEEYRDILSWERSIQARFFIARAEYYEKERNRNMNAVRGVYGLRLDLFASAVLSEDPEKKFNEIYDELLAEKTAAVEKRNAHLAKRPFGPALQ